MFRALLLVSVLAAVTAQSIHSCSSFIAWSSLSVFPSAPTAGDVMSVNGTGTLSVPVTGGDGTINAYLYDADVWAGPISTCGLGQEVNVMGVAQGTLDALVCPISAGAAVSIGFVLPIPQVAEGLGTLLIIVASNNTATPEQAVLCLNLTITL